NFQVGELSQDVYNPEELGVVCVKMLKSQVTRVDKPIWDLMMKNIYSLGAFQVSNEDFLFDIYYEDPGKGFKRFLPETNLAGLPLLRVFNMDRLNVQGDPCPDGIFDFVPGITINPRNGRVMFPVLEPFGSNLVADMEPQFQEKFEYFHLYDSTITRAREYPDLNRFAIRGSYKSSISSEISLNSFNLPEGSVSVTAGGVRLIEGLDYEVDYNIGKVRILNDAYLNSGTPVNVNFEDNSLFTFQQKTLLGLRADYEFNKNLTVGGTYMHLFERPFTQKVNIGDDPISNRMVGLDVNYSNEAPWLTKAVDAIPFISTKEESSMTFAAEAAFLKPGHARAINLNNELDDNGQPIQQDKGGTLNIDDFEGSATGFDLRNPSNRWVLASVPQNDPQNNNPLFPESQFIDSLVTGMNRAKLAWYRIDDAIRNGEDREDPYRSIIPIQEIFPNRANPISIGQTNQIPSLDLHYTPMEKGPYNFEFPNGVPGYTAGLNPDGSLVDPSSRWAGIMRELPTNDFEAANIEYIEFWMLNPFMDVENPGDLYINLGNVSEDILKDSRRAFENGLPTDQNNVRTDFTSWGQVPRVQSFTNAFSQDQTERMQQDVGLDGLDDDKEREQFQDIIDLYNSSGLSADAKQDFIDDPSNDNFTFFRDQEKFGNSLQNPDFDIFERYHDNNNPQGNSEASDGNQVTSATNIPDAEDLNRDNSLNENEQYFQYHIPLEPVLQDDGGYGLDIDGNDIITEAVRQEGQGSERRTWYRFRIPVEQYSSKVGGIQDFRSIQFIRMYMHGFEQEITLRFATLELTRNQWRKYRRPVDVKPLTGVPSFPDDFQFDLNAVSIEENSSRTPFNYVLPPGVQREAVVVGNSAAGALPQNEQSLSLIVDDLPVDSAVGIYKILNLDMRVFEEMELFVHAEARLRDQYLVDDDLALFIRLGSDFENNFYEYEMPLNISDSTQLINDPAVVWPEDNRLILNLKQFIEMKKQRNEEGFSLTNFYEQEDLENEYPGRKYRIKGNPNLGLVKGVMIGIVNRDNREFRNHSAEVWVNELRVHGLDESGAGAALARLDFKLADFGTFSMAANYSSNGWGGIEQKLAQRAREEVFQYDVATNLELGKFFKEESGLKIPMYASLSKTIRTPQFDPYDLDIPLREKLNSADSQIERDSIKDQAQDVTSIRSLNFTNVRKAKTNDKKPMPWDISNFSATYAFVETERNNPIIESDKERKYRGAIDYSYQLKPLYIEPFKKLIKKDKYLKLLSEANFNLVPNSFSFSTNIDREFQETKYRFTDLADEFSTFYNKRFTWDRNYNLNWDITKALKFNYSAINRAIVDELKQFDDDGLPIAQSRLKEELWSNIKDFGRTKDYSHNIGLNYTLPFKKIPLLDFINIKASYTATYNWAGAAIGINGAPGIADTLGNVIQNSQVRQINGDLNFETLYKKSKYLAKIDRPQSGRGNSRGQNRRSQADQDDGDSNDRGSRRNRRGGDDKSGADNVDDKSTSDDNGNNSRSRRNRNGGDNAGDAKDNKSGGRSAGPKRKGNRTPTTIEKVLVRPLMTIRKARFNYTENLGTVVPGFLPRPDLLG
ncbi:MAG: cell surface protein SprA, partial [Saprospiraceae bacterium]|nr:cell surface protein SprA [Saprospiraceae bacterium]